MGLKQITDLVNIGANVNESAAGVYTESTVGINLSPVDRQVFVITDVSFTATNPERIPNTMTQNIVQVCKTTQTAIIGANDSDLISRTERNIYGGGAEFSGQELDFSGTQASTGGKNDYLMILATEDAFLGILGTANVGTMWGQVRITGFYATADAATYNALVLSELQN